MPKPIRQIPNRKAIYLRKDIYEIIRDIAHTNHTYIVDEVDKILREKLIPKKEGK